MTGPKTDFADQIHAEKYRLPGESFDEAMNRIAAALTESTEEYRIRQPLLRLRSHLRDRFLHLLCALGRHLAG